MSEMTLAEKIQSLLDTTKETLKKMVNGEAFLTDDETYKKRFAICAGCTHFDPDKNKCGICGCPMATKCLFAASKCPDNPPKW